METYFIDWEILDKENKVISWTNSIVESSLSPKETISGARKTLEEKYGEDYQFRARAFNKI